MRAPGVAAPIVAGFIAILVAACHKKDGGPCTGNEQVCADKSNALVCRGGQYTKVACTGPLACSKFQDRVNCDTSTANLGDPCMGDDDEFACSPDKKKALVCKRGKFDLHMNCLGQNGCSLTGRAPNCDVSIGNKGDPCPKPDSFACSEDGKQMLVCHLGKFDIYRYCRGGNACVAKTDGPACDESLSMLGDPCGIPGQVVCATDGKTELICQGGAFIKSRTCKTSCSIASAAGRSVDCH